MKVKYRSCPPKKLSRNVQTVVKHVKVDVKVYNDKMASAAKRKNLSECLNIFNSVGQPTKHSYANLLNACVRCGDMQMAEHYYSEMLDKMGKCLVTSTTLLKGYFLHGMKDSAKALFYSIRVDHPGENTERALDTFLRGCLRTGMIDEAIEAFGKAEFTSPASVEMYHHILYMTSVIHGKEHRYDPTASQASHLFAAKSLILNGRSQEALIALDAADACAQLSVRGDIKFEAHKSSENLREAMMLRNAIAKNLSFTSFRDYLNKSFALVDSHADMVSKISCLDDFGSAKLEICSGLGHWIIEKCKEDPTTLWIASEIRFDRSFEILVTSFLAGISNILVLSGDVNRLVPFLPDESMRGIYINFPEPPAWHEASNDSKSDLLSREFISALPCRLAEGGSVRILTDNGSYAATVLTRMREIQEDASVRTFKSEGSSYFDRMFQRGGKSTRYELVITR